MRASRTLSRVEHIISAAQISPSTATPSARQAAPSPPHPHSPRRSSGARHRPASAAASPVASASPRADAPRRRRLERRRSSGDATHRWPTRSSSRAASSPRPPQPPPPPPPPRRRPRRLAGRSRPPARRGGRASRPLARTRAPAGSLATRCAPSYPSRNWLGCLPARGDVALLRVSRRFFLVLWLGPTSCADGAEGGRFVLRFFGGLGGLVVAEMLWTVHASTSV